MLALQSHKIHQNNYICTLA